VRTVFVFCLSIKALVAFHYVVHYTVPTSPARPLDVNFEDAVKRGLERVDAAIRNRCGVERRGKRDRAVASRIK